MASLLKRTTILTVSRIANQAIVLLSPLILVRLLSVSEYGSYREFILYASIIGAIVTLGVPHSLPYLIPKHPDRERTWVTQSALLIFAFNSVAIVLIALAGDYLRATTSFDFVSALQLYVLFCYNLDFVEFYWLAKKRTENVFFYSSGRLVARIVVVIAVAMTTRSAQSIIFSLIIVEAARFLLVLIYALYNRWFTRAVSRQSLGRQTSYFLPLGGGGLVEFFNGRLGMLFISIYMGAEALAMYAIGAFAIQFVNILRGSIADVIFPEIMEMKHAEPKDALPLWRRATLWYCILLFPAGLLLCIYSDAFVIFLFTSKYAAAVPVFSVYAVAFFLLCFDFHLPLRVQNANRHYVVAALIGLFTNSVLLYPLYLAAGLVGPAIAFVLSRLAITVYLSISVKRVYRVGLSQMALWRNIGMVFAAAFAGIPLLLLGKLAFGSVVIQLVVVGTAYMLVYLALLRHMQVWDSVATFRVLVAGARRLGKA
jgi:O-antigen/teichoic acid export membrane protein